MKWIGKVMLTFVIDLNSPRLDEGVLGKNMSESAPVQVHCHGYVYNGLLQKVHWERLESQRT